MQYCWAHAMPGHAGLLNSIDTILRGTLEIFYHGDKMLSTLLCAVIHAESVGEAMPITSL